MSTVELPTPIIPQNPTSVMGSSPSPLEDSLDMESDRTELSDDGLEAEDSEVEEAELTELSEVLL